MLPPGKVADSDCIEPSDIERRTVTANLNISNREGGQRLISKDGNITKLDLPLIVNEDLPNMTTGDSVEPMETAVRVDDKDKDLTNVPKGMEGENGHQGSAEDASDDDDYKPEATFRYEVKQLSKTKVGGSQLSPSCMIRGLPWKIMAMCREANRGPRTLGFFLQCNAESDLQSWSCNAQATLRMLSQKEGVTDYERKISHVFFPKENDWGFSNFMQWDHVLDPEKGHIKDDTIILEVEVRADAPHGVQWDSKKHTGYVGLKNQGATCYMNSLLQTLFFTNRLRRAVYQMPTESDDTQKSVALAMQRVFYELQFSDKPVGTKKLTRSFGWETFDSFLQHDVQELNRVLLDNLESKMKGTPVEGTIPKLFEGKMKSYVRCKTVPFESKREEPFYDIQLNVKGQANIYESFKDYIAVESLDGENKYDAGDYGLQEAEKGVIFLKFPPVLHLQLMRFTYDPQHDQNVKINDRFEFPEKLKLDEFVEAPEVGRGPATYTLHAVLVHSGDFHGGHYVVYINPKGNGKWCKFDDDVVSRCTKQEAIEANYGGNDSELPSRQCTNAYMLVYIRDSMLDDILLNVLDREIPTSLKERLQDEREQEAMKKKEKSEAHLYTIVNLITEDCFEGHQGFDLIDFESENKLTKKLRVRKATSIKDLYEILGQQLDLKPFSQFRLWAFRMRHDGAVRPVFLKPEDLSYSIGNLLQHIEPELQFFLEIIDISTGEKELRQYDAEKDTVVFLKYYSPENRRIIYCGHAFVPHNTTLEQLKPEMRRRAALPSDAKLLIYHEDSPSRIEHVENCNMTLNTFSPGDSFDGLILVFQLAILPSANNYELPTVNEYFRELSNRIEVELFDKMEPNAEPIIIIASLRWNYVQFVETVGKQLNHDPYKIQFFKQNAYKEAAGQLIKWNPSLTVKEMLSNPQQRNRGARGRLYFQKVPLRVDEMEHKLQLRVMWVDSRMKPQELTVYPDKEGTVKHLQDEVRKQVQLPESGTGKLRFLLVNNGRIVDIVSSDQPLEELHREFSSREYRVEEVPPDQLVVDPKLEYLLPVAHFHKDHFQLFGTPFLLKVRHGEPFSSVKARVQKLLEVTDKDFEKYKFALCTTAKCSYFDNDNFTINLNELSVQSSMPGRPWLGLEHVNKNPKSRGAFPMEKAIIIHN